jgi:hypothetical protein
MIVRFVLWNLADSLTNVRELRRYLRDETVDAFADVEGLRLKAWISDEVTERWGAVYLFESEEAARRELPSQARDLIGKERRTSSRSSSSRRRSKAGTKTRRSRGSGSPSSEAGTDEAGSRLVTPAFGSRT